MTVIAVVSPASSREEQHERNSSDRYLSRIQQGRCLTACDWDELAHEKTKLPLLEQVSRDHAPEGQLVRCLGMVQDMLQAGYVVSNLAARQTMVEQTRLVVVPIPFTTPWYRQALYDTDAHHRDKRVRLDTPEPVNSGVVAHFYYDQYVPQTPKLLLNQLVEMVGVLEPHYDDDDDAMDVADFPAEWEQEEHLRDLPVLQVLWYRTFRLEQPAATPNHPVGFGLDDPTLARALGVDAVTAQAIGATLLSRAVAGSPHNRTLGCAALSLVTTDPAALHARLERVLTDLVPVLVSHRLSDLQTCRSAWQWPAGAVVVVRVDAAGPGLDALQQLAARHTVPYRFDGGVTMDFEADVAVLIVCTPDTQNRVPCLLQVRAPQLVQSNESCWSLRSALAAARCGPTIPLDKDVLERAQGVFLQRRQWVRDRATATPSTTLVVNEMSMHRWLTLTRICARARGSQRAALRDWQQALALDDAMVGWQ